MASLYKRLAKLSMNSVDDNISHPDSKVVLNGGVLPKDIMKLYAKGALPAAITPLPADDSFSPAPNYRDKGEALQAAKDYVDNLTPYVEPPKVDVPPSEAAPAD